MILDLEKFIQTGQPFWTELETLLGAIEKMPGRSLSFHEIRRLYYLYQRVSADLARVETFAAAPEIRAYLEALVARTYAEIHDHRHPARFFGLWHWFSVIFPSTIRRHPAALALSTSAVLVGALLGAVLLLIDPDTQPVLLPPWLRMETPTERVTREQKMFQERDPLAGHKTSFAARLLSNNVRVSLVVAGLGITFGLGSLLLLFQNGLMLGAVIAQYAADGQTFFMLGWLLPHGVIEIPSVLLAGQAGMVLAAALIGRHNRLSLYHRLRAAAPDFLTLIAGVALLLCWAAGMEAFFSQYHEPVLPYWLKIVTGMVEFIALLLFVSLAGRNKNVQPSRSVTG